MFLQPHQRCQIHLQMGRTTLLHHLLFNWTMVSPLILLHHLEAHHGWAGSGLEQSKWRLLLNQHCQVKCWCIKKRCSLTLTHPHTLLAHQCPPNPVTQSKSPLWATHKIILWDQLVHLTYSISLLLLNCLSRHPTLLSMLQCRQLINRSQILTHLAQFPPYPGCLKMMQVMRCVLQSTKWYLSLMSPTLLSSISLSSPQVLQQISTHCSHHSHLILLHQKPK